MRRIIYIFILFSLFCHRGSGSEYSVGKADGKEVSDTVCVSDSGSAYADEEKKFCGFKPTQLIAPALLIGAGVTGVTIPAVKNLNREVDDYFKRTYNTKIYVDDFAQYLPLVSVYGINLSGIRGRHGYLESTVIIATSYAAMGVMVNAVKYSVRERRPDGSSRNSFPSGHTATAFMGAEILRTEYRDVSPWIGIGGYLVAAGVGACRVYNHRHWVTDVLAGAGIGILSARIGYWMFPVWQRLLFQGKNTKNRYVNCSPYYNGEQIGVGVSMRF